MITYQLLFGCLLSYNCEIEGFKHCSLNVNEHSSFYNRLLRIVLHLQTFQRLAKHGVTQSRESFRNLMDDVGGDLINEMKQLVKTEGKPRMVFDNFDFKILANIILPNHRNSDIHWIGQFITFDRFPSDHLDDTKPLVSDIKLFNNKEYLLT